MVLRSKSGGVGEGSYITKVRGSADRYTRKEVTRYVGFGNLWKTYNAMFSRSECCDNRGRSKIKAALEGFQELGEAGRKITGSSFYLASSATLKHLQ